MFLSHLVGVFRQWRRYNQSLRELNRLGDRELADIGITRGDIPRVAWDNSERYLLAYRPLAPALGGRFHFGWKRAARKACLARLG